MAGEVQLGQVGEIIMGQSPPGETYNEHGDGLPFFQGVADFNYRHPTPRVFCTAPSRIALPGDILLSVRAPIGRVNVADRTCAIGRGLAIIRPKAQKDGRYLEFVLRMLEPTWHLIEGGGSVFGNATRRDLETLRIPWHENACERHAIAHILGTLDDKIELNRRMSETLEAMARALFKAWFVDFEPVRAKMEGRWQRGQSLPGLPAHLYDIFPDRLVESELGEIPEGWSVGTLAEIVELVRDHVNPLSEPASEFLHFSIPAFDEGQWPKLERGEEIKSQKWQVPPGVVLLSKLNPEIERVWLVDVKPDDRAVCSTEFLVLQPKPPYGRVYVYCLTRSPLFRQQIEGLVTGTSKSHQRAQPSAILELAAIKPSAPVVPAFDRAAASLLDRTLECRRESRTLAALRDALLPKLIRGEIRVKDAERFLKERGL
jgi:type I restriction enzyme, S subunit